MHEWTLTIINVNKPPTIDSYHPISDPSINEGDPDGDPVVVQWYLSGTPTVTTDFYNFVADCGSTGIYNVTIVVSDGELSDSKEWALIAVFGGIHDIAALAHGDINGDTYVNAKDAVLLSGPFYPFGVYNPNTDINGDRFGNAKDAVILGKRFNEHQN